MPIGVFRRHWPPRLSRRFVPGYIHGFRQVSFRWRNDDGNETTATWKENQDIDTAVNTDSNIRIRFVVVNR